jgi:hypothetical protein
MGRALRSSGLKRCAKILPRPASPEGLRRSGST